MDVSRIEAISPRQIDWRRLTANQIIKYQEQGVDVPSQYIQWAQNFVNSIYSDDVTTYEMSESNSNTISPQKTSVDTTTTTTSESETSPTVDDTNQDENEDEKNLSASDYVALLKSQGMGKIPIAGELKTKSEEKKVEADNSADICSTSADSAAVSIENLESYMSDLLSQANDIKSQMQQLKNKKDDTGSNISKLNKLSQQLKNLGTTGQNTVSVYSGEFSGLQSLVSEQLMPINSASDYGETTIEAGKNLLAGPWLVRFRRNVIKAGENAVSASETAQGIQSQADNSIAQDINSANSFKHEITATTGVANASINENGNNKQSNNEESKSPVGSNSNSQKSDKTSQNDKTDLANNQTASLDEILKKKIREGQYVDGANV
mgnify:FL=1